jgi:hypothetical protein
MYEIYYQFQTLIRSHTISAIGNITPEKTVELGHARVVRKYLLGRMMGGYA